MSRSRKIEMLGLPGAGKTTLSEGLCAALRAHGWRVVDRGEQQTLVGKSHARRSRVGRVGHYLRFQVGEPSLLLSAVRFAAHPRPVLWEGFYRAYHLARLVHNDAIAERIFGDDVTFVLDQSILQEVWGVIYLRECTREDLLDRLLSELGAHLPDLTVHVDLDPGVALARLRERTRRLGPQGDLERMDDLSVETMAHTHGEFVRIRRRLQAMGKRVVVVRADWPLAKQVACVLVALDRELHAGARHLEEQ